MKPVCIDLFCGLGGWTDGFLAEGYECIGFDLERHNYGQGSYPGQLVLQDILTLHGSQFRDAAVIVASPPCQNYSYMAMPWSRAKQIAGALREEIDFPEEYNGPRTVAELNAPFDSCFRIQREASEAAGRYIPLVAENVKGAQPWVGIAKAHYGSFYLWGDVGSVSGAVVGTRPRFGETLRATRRAHKFNPDGTEHRQGSWFKIADSVNRGANGRKVEGFNFHEYEQTGKPGRSFQSASVEGVKVAIEDGARRTDIGNGARFTTRDCGIEASVNPPDESTKLGGSWFHGYRKGQGPRNHGSNSRGRKAASAQIAKIPEPLSRHIARIYKP